MHCAEKLVFVCWHAGSASAEREGGWGHPQGAVYMAAVRLGCKSNMVGTGLANSHLGCMSRLRKCHSHLLGGSFLAGKAS